ncbi:hypothetical protein AB6806_05690 [Bosea sp. RCC_152_1]|uniref:hypothetical protein n=1 Tax=Bosea sp. RCC_152_1 TaxID=3239228 RepID=UPI00352462AC
MAQLAEAYFHVRRVSLSVVELKQLGDDASKIAAKTALEFFPPDTILDVRLAEGSVRGWITVIGALTIPIYGVVADYKGFKESVTEIISDGRKFSELVTESITSAKELEGARIYRRERRTKTPGKIKRIIEKRQWLEEHRRQLSAGDAAHVDHEIEQMLQSVLADIEPAARAAMREALGEDVPHIPLSEEARIAVRPTRGVQEPLLLRLDSTEPAPETDYHRRFKLSDWATDDDPPPSPGRALLPPIERN